MSSEDYLKGLGVVSVDGVTIDTETGEIIEAPAQNENGRMAVLATRRADGREQRESWARTVAIYDSGLLNLLGDRPMVALPEVGLTVKRGGRKDTVYDMVGVANELAFRMAAATTMEEVTAIGTEAIQLLVASSGLRAKQASLLQGKAADLVKRNTTVNQSKPWIETPQILKLAPAVEKRAKQAVEA